MIYNSKKIKALNYRFTVSLKKRLSIFQNKTRTKSQQNLNKISTKSQQNLNKISTVLFCCVLIMLCFYCFELENSVNSGTLLSEPITSFQIFSELQIKIKVTLSNSRMIYNKITTVLFCCALFRLGVLFLLLFCCDFV